MASANGTAHAAASTAAGERERAHKEKERKKDKREKKNKKEPREKREKKSRDKKEVQAERPRDAKRSQSFASVESALPLGHALVEHHLLRMDPSLREAEETLRRIRHQLGVTEDASLDGLLRGLSTLDAFAARLEFLKNKLQTTEAIVQHVVNEMPSRRGTATEDTAVRPEPARTQSSSAYDPMPLSKSSGLVSATPTAVPLAPGSSSTERKEAGHSISMPPSTAAEPPLLMDGQPVSARQRAQQAPPQQPRTTQQALPSSLSSSLQPPPPSQQQQQQQQQSETHQALPPPKRVVETSKPSEVAKGSGGGGGPTSKMVVRTASRRTADFYAQYGDKDRVAP